MLSLAQVYCVLTAWLAILAGAVPSPSPEANEASLLHARQSVKCPVQIHATIPNNPTTFVYDRIYMGQGFTENYNNPGNRNPRITLYIDGTTKNCDAVQQCVQAARNQGGGYLSVDVHYRLSSARWECVMWYGPNRDKHYFNVQDGDVGDVYGYSS